MFSIECREAEIKVITNYRDNPVNQSKLEITGCQSLSIGTQNQSKWKLLNDTQVKTVLTIAL